MSNNHNVGTPLSCDFHSYHLAVFIGRFQPFHDGHLSVVTSALEIADTLLVLVGSSEKPRDTFNPFTFEERKAMILGSIDERSRSRVLVLPLVDHLYNDSKWVVQVQERVAQAREHFTLDRMAKIALIGHSKDNSSYYLKMFPQWGSVEVPNFRGLSATPMRQTFFKGDMCNHVPDATQRFLEAFRHGEIYEDVRGEFEFIERYKEPYRSMPYPPVFVTVDAVVVQSGHVLMIERRARPGKGLLALPGGFLGQTETVLDGAIRELREETRLKVPSSVLRGSIVSERVFDSPHRSARGRTITHAFYFKLADDIVLPKVKGGDDARRAKWIPIGDVQRSQCFEDHFDIIDTFVS